MKGFRWQRNDDEALLNGGIKVTIGGCGDENTRKEIRVREPSMQTIYDQFDIVLGAIQQLSDQQRTWLEEVVADRSQFVLTDLRKFAPVVRALENILSLVVHEEVEWVREEMSPRQVSEVLAHHLRAVGVETIRDLFLSGRAHFTKVMEQSQRTSFAPSDAQS